MICTLKMTINVHTPMNASTFLTFTVNLPGGILRTWSAPTYPTGRWLSQHLLAGLKSDEHILDRLVFFEKVVVSCLQPLLDISFEQRHELLFIFTHTVHPLRNVPPSRSVVNTVDGYPTKPKPRPNSLKC